MDCIKIDPKKFKNDPMVFSPKKCCIVWGDFVFFRWDFNNDPIEISQCEAGLVSW